MSLIPWWTSAPPTWPHEKSVNTYVKPLIFAYFGSFSVRERVSEAQVNAKLNRPHTTCTRLPVRRVYVVHDAAHPGRVLARPSQARPTSSSCGGVQHES